MGKGSSTLHAEDLSVMRTEAHGAGFALDCSLVLTEPDLHPTAYVPGHGEVWIERDGPLDHVVRIVELAHHKGKGDSRRPERHRVILAKLSNPSCQALDFSYLVSAVDRPADPLALAIASRRHAIGRSETGVEFQRPVEV